MPELLQTAHRRVLAAALTLGVALAVALSGCGPQDDPTKGDVPSPPRTTATGPAAEGDRAVAGGDGDQASRGRQKDDGGDDDDDDDDGSDQGSGGGGGDGGRRGGGGDDSDGGDDDDNDEPPVPAVRTTLRLTMRDGDPPEFNTSSLVARPGRVTLILRNLDDEQHGIAVHGTDIQRESKPADQGETVSLTVDLPAGDYEFFCPVDDHRLRENSDGLLTESGLLSIG